MSKLPRRGNIESVTDPFPRTGLVKQYEPFIRGEVGRYCRRYPDLRGDDVLFKAVELAVQAEVLFKDFSTFLHHHLKGLHRFAEQEHEERSALGADQAANVTVDAEWYLSQYPGVRAAVQNGQFKSAEEHYRTHGFNEKRLPAKPKFDEEFYLRAYPDVADAVRNGQFKSGYEHYFAIGCREGRKALP